MGFELDTIVRKLILSVPTIVNTDFISESVNIGGVEADFATHILYDSGLLLDATLYLQISLDNVNFVDINDSDQVITDPTGTHVWDVQGSGGSFLRVRIEVRSGSFQINEIRFDGKRRH